MNTREYFLSQGFFDDDRYPYGFKRSGDFTIGEALALEDKGALFQALQNGEVSDPAPEDLQLIKVIKGEAQASTTEEKAWLKYSRGKKRTQVWLNDSEKRPVSRADSDDDAEPDIDYDLDEDFED